MLLDQPRKPRIMDNSNGEARRAVAETVAHFAPWRADLAHFAVMVERHIRADDREKILNRCAVIEDELMQARTELLLGLADAPQKVSGHSRVVDVERALDNIEAGVKLLRGRLTQ